MKVPGGAKVLGMGVALACLSLLAASALGAQQSPAVRFAAPRDGSTLPGPNVVVRLEVDGVVLGGRASDGAFALLSLDGAPPVKSYSQRFTFRGVGAGEHRLHVELRRNDGAAFSPPVEARVQFRLGDRGKG